MKWILIIIVIVIIVAFIYITEKTKTVAGQISGTVPIGSAVDNVVGPFTTAPTVDSGLTKVLSGNGSGSLNTSGW